MDYGKIQIPYIGNLAIKNKAETFRAKYWNKVLPVDIEKIIDVKSVHTDVPKELSFIKVVRTVKYFTELSIFKNGVIIGPGDIKYAHGPDERVSKKELAEAVEVYSQIINNFSSAV